MPLIFLCIREFHDVQVSKCDVGAQNGLEFGACKILDFQFRDIQSV